MRNIFANTLIDIASYDEKLVLLMAEVGFGVVESYEKLFPERFYNTGISEQNLILTACGLAMQGMHPVAYSMSSFLPTRAFEMIKDAVCYQKLPVTLVGIGSGISYGKLGSTHHAPEEFALMNCLPNMRVIFPANGDECRAALKYAIRLDSPCYIGLEKCRAVIMEQEFIYSPKWKKYENKCKKTNIVLIAVGYLLNLALEVMDALEVEGIGCNIYSAQTLKPFDDNAIREACEIGNIFIIEEQYRYGGIGTGIAQFILENNLFSKISHFEVVGLSDKFMDVVSDEDTILKNNGICLDEIIRRVRRTI